MSTAKHWHKMWVASGLKRKSSLTPEELREFRAEFADRQINPWGNDKIQRYCKTATEAIKRGAALPSIKHWNEQ